MNKIITSIIEIDLSGLSGTGSKTIVDYDRRTIEMIIGKSIWGRNVRGSSNKYAFLKVKGKTILLHRYIMGVAFNNLKEVDHINGNTLDNRAINLRVCNRDENAKNRLIGKNNSSGYKGVHLVKLRLKYREKNPHVKLYSARIGFESTSICLGHYETPEEAAYVYDQVALQLHGEFAKTNFYYDNNVESLDNPAR